MIPRLKPDYNYEELIAAFSFFRKNSVCKFEEEFAKKLETEYALAFPYGRSALYAILKSLNISNQEIILPAYTCVVVANAIVHSGNIPRFVDISLDDYNMDLNLLEQNITERTGAIIATHLFGYPLNVNLLNEIVNLAEKKYGKKIRIIQDCAHSFGAKWNEMPVNTKGDVAFYGLNVSKIISSIFGGMITTNDHELYRKLEKYRRQTFKTPTFLKTLKRLLYLVAVKSAFNKSIYGFINYLEEETKLIDSFTQYYQEDIIDLPQDYEDFMIDIEARVGLIQLNKYNKILKRRREIAHYYSDKLQDLKQLILPPIKDGATYSHYVIRVDNRKKYMNYMRKRGVQLGWLIEYSIPELKAYQKWKITEYPNSNRCAQTTINLPNWPGMRKKELDYIITELFKLENL